MSNFSPKYNGKNGDNLKWKHLCLPRCYHKVMTPIVKPKRCCPSALYSYISLLTAISLKQIQAKNPFHKNPL